MSPLEYVHTLRLEEAKQMLETGDAPIEAIANEVGYEDAGFFSRLFRRQVELTPAQYRRRFGAMRRALQSASGARRSIEPPSHCCVTDRRDGSPALGNPKMTTAPAGAVDSAAAVRLSAAAPERGKARKGESDQRERAGLRTTRIGPGLPTTASSSGSASWARTRSGSTGHRNSGSPPRTCSRACRR